VALLAAFVGIVVGVTRRRVRRAPPYTVPQEPDVPDSRSVPLKTLQLIDLEQTAKILAGIGLFLYILGLMNVNGYLFTFGVTDFSLIRTRFIYTGALIASSAFICGLPLVLGPFRRELKTAIEKTLHGLRESEAKKAAGKGSFHRWKYRALRVTARLILVTVWSMAAALIVLTPPVLLYGLYLSQFSTSDIELVTREPTSMTPTIARMSVVCLVYTVGFLNAWHIGRVMRKARKKTAKARVDSPQGFAMDIGADLFLALAVTTLYCIIFMTFVYPVVPQQYGGGRPQQVSLLFRDDAVRGMQQLRVPLQQKGQQISAPLALVHETDDVYVVRLRDKRVLRIDRDLVAAVVNES
jgi:hypothetical protein